MTDRTHRHAPRARRAPRTRADAEFSSPACLLHEFASAPAPAAAASTGAPAANGVQIKRIYDEREAADGFRVLVDRLWPRGISKQRAALDEWRADLAPSTALRKWFHQDRGRWAEFRRRYRAELRALDAQLQTLREHARRERVTLLYAAQDRRLNHAVVLREVLDAPPRRSPARKTK